MATFEKLKTKDGQKRIKAKVRLKGFAPRYATFTTMEKAREWATDTEANMRAGRVGMASASDHYTVAQMIERYLDKVLPFKTKKKRYIRQQTQQLEWWKEQLGLYRLSNLSKPVIIEAIDRLKKDRGPATVNRYHAAFAHVLNVAVKDWEWLKESPIAAVRKLKEPRGRSRFLREEERPDFLQACAMETRKPLYLIVVLAIATGARKEEITKLRLRNIDLKQGTALVEETKNSEPKTFFINGYPLDLLRVYVERFKCFRREYLFSNRSGKLPITIDREFRRARDRAGVTDFVIHDLRHTHASYLAIHSAADAKVIQESLNQKTPAMAARYTHLTRGHLVKHVETMTDAVFGSNHQPEAQH